MLPEELVVGGNYTDRDGSIRVVDYIGEEKCFVHDLLNSALEEGVSKATIISYWTPFTETKKNPINALLDAFVLSGIEALDDMDDLKKYYFLSAIGYETYLKPATTPAAKATVAYESINYTALNSGALGNDITLSFDGAKSIKTVMGEWNDANLQNQVVADANDFYLIPAPESMAVQASATYLTVEFRSILFGTAGNGIVLTFDGTTPVASIVNDWNIANPTLAVELIDNSNAIAVLASGSVPFAGGAQLTPKLVYLLGGSDETLI